MITRTALLTLHTEECTQTSNYCYAAGYVEGNKGTTITYGNENVTEGVLTSGDAFDCDVNGDGKIKMYDAFSILRNVLFNTGTMSQIDILISDFDNDGKVKMQDAFSYLKQALFE